MAFFLDNTIPGKSTIVYSFIPEFINQFCHPFIYQFFYSGLHSSINPFIYPSLHRPIILFTQQFITPIHPSILSYIHRFTYIKFCMLPHFYSSINKSNNPSFHRTKHMYNMSNMNILHISILYKNILYSIPLVLVCYNLSCHGYRDTRRERNPEMAGDLDLYRYDSSYQKVL